MVPALATNLPGQLRMLDVIRTHLEDAETMLLSVSFLRFSGLQLIIDDLVRFTENGGRARVLTSTYMSHTQPEALRQLASLEGVEARLHFANPDKADGFHPKFLVFDGLSGGSCWVGSSNLSKGGLTSNVEANLRHDDPEIVARVSSTFDILWERPDTFPLDGSVIDHYSMAFLEAQSKLMASVSAPLPQTPSSPSRTTYAPNEAQREALAQLKRLRLAGETRAIAIAATGVGKTFLAAFDALQADAKSVLFVSHRLEHLAQASETFAKVFPSTFSTGLVSGSEKSDGADLVFATVRSANNSDRLAKRHFDYMVVDEFHHAAAPSYRKLLDSVSPRFLLGLTATPEREDGHEILKLCDYNVAYEVRLIEAIRREWLIPFHYFGISDDTVDYNASFWRQRRFDPDEVENALMLEKRVEHILGHACQKGFDGPKRVAVGFCAGVKHARFMAESFLDRGEQAIALTGEDALEQRRDIYERLQDPRDELEWLFVSDLLNEGVDLPAINTLLFLRPTQSATVFLQQLGRGLRLSPDCSVLTVLDFVGRHRNAWLSLEALADKGAPRGARTHEEFDITPPEHCEIILDDKTHEVLREVNRYTRRKKDRCKEAYREVREEIGEPPFPIDLIGRENIPTPSEFRGAFGSWLACRKEMGDAEPWEEALDTESLAYEMLRRAELDWQQQRVYAYALFWGYCHSPEAPEDGYNAFFERFPRWNAEFAELSTTKAQSTIGKKLGSCLGGQRLPDEILDAFPDTRTMLEHVEKRLRYVLESDYKTRHGGVLRTPAELDIHRKYSRPEILNHFGLQYDPARHNQGVLAFGEKDPSSDHIALITKLDTSTALQNYQYKNAFDPDDVRCFYWQSQNKQRQDNDSGRRILDHADLGVTLHLFVQSKSHSSPTYMGPVDVVDVSGNGPMNVTFRLIHVPPESVIDDLNGRR